MATWYTNSATGTSSGPGTIGAPYQTIAQVIAVLAAGDTVNAEGTFAENNSAIANGFTLQGYGTGYIINGLSGAVALQWKNWTGAISVLGGTINSPTGGFGALQCFATDGVARTAGITFNGVTCTGGTNVISIEVGTTYSGYTSNILIENCNVSGGSDYGILVATQATPHYVMSNVNITGNNVSGITGRSSTTITGMGIQVTGTDNSVAANFIQHNAVSNCGAAATGTGGPGPVGCMVYFAKFVTIQYNVVSGIFANLDAHGDGIGVDIDNGNTTCTACYNMISYCQGAGLSLFSSTGGTTHQMFGNICVGCASLSSDTDNGSLSLQGTDAINVFNNTFLNTGALPALTILNGSTPGKKIYNNAFYCPAGIPTAILPASITGLAMDGNYHQSGTGLFSATFNGTNRTTLAAWRTATSLEASSVAAGAGAYFVQPQPPPATFAGVSAYAPIAGSPLLGAGITLSGVGITGQPDILGNAYTQGIGAVNTAGAPTGYMATVLADSPLAVFRLAEPSGTIFSDSIPSFEGGTWTAATLGQGTIVPGDGGTSVLCNGTSTVGTGVTTPHAYSLTSMSVGFWLEYTAAGYQVSSYNAANNFNDFSCYVASNFLTFYVHNASGFIQGQLQGYSIPVGTPLYIVWTVTGSTITAYVNGVSQTVTMLLTTMTGSFAINRINIADNGVSPSFFNGTISDVELYPAVLSQARALAHYNAGITSPLIAAAVNFNGGFSNDFAGGIDG